MDQDKIEVTQESLSSTLESVDRAEQIAIREAGLLGLGEDSSTQFGMAVRECTVNAVVHGNRYSANKLVHVLMERGADTLTVTIGDEGEGFDPVKLPDPLAPENLLRQSGRGLLLIRAFVDQIDVHERAGGGTEVKLIKHRSAD